MTGLNAKYNNWYKNDCDHPLWVIADRFGVVDMSQASKLKRAIKIHTEITVDNKKEIYAVFDDGVKQPLGENQKSRYDSFDLNITDIKKGLIN